MFHGSNDANHAVSVVTPTSATSHSQPRSSESQRSNARTSRRSTSDSDASRRSANASYRDFSARNGIECRRNEGASF